MALSSHRLGDGGRGPGLSVVERRDIVGGSDGGGDCNCSGCV